MQKEEKDYVELKFLTQSIQLYIDISIYIFPFSLPCLLVSPHIFKILLCLVFDLLSDVVQCYIL